MRKYSSVYGLGSALMGLLMVCDATHFAMGQASGPPAPGGQELRIRVLDEKNLGIRVLVNLGIDRLQQSTAYTDWSGNATFHGLPPGTYTLVISAAGEELYRNKLTSNNGEGFRSEVVRLHNVAFAGRTDTVSLNDLGAPPEAYRKYLAGVEAIRTGNLEEALRVLDEALKIYPAYSKCHNARGVLFHMTRSSKEAEDAFRHGIQFDADSLEPRLNLGNLLLESDRPSEARSVLQKALEFDAGNLTAIELLLESLLMTHDEVSAVPVRSLHQGSVKHPAQVHLRLASALASHGMADLALEQYSLVLQDDPSSYERSEADEVLSRTQNQTEDH